MFNVTRVRELMAVDLVVVEPTANIQEAVRLMLDHGVSGLPVVGASGNLVGIITEHDCLRVFFRDQYLDLPSAAIAEAMTPTPTTIDAEADVMTAVEIFVEQPFRRLPVTKDGKLVGLLSRRDALRAIRAPASGT